MEWIDIKEQLPEPDKSLLLNCADRQFDHDDMVVKGWYCPIYKTFFSSEAHEDEDIIFTHWQYLPEPAKP